MATVEVEGASFSVGCWVEAQFLDGLESQKWPEYNRIIPRHHLGLAILRTPPRSHAVQDTENVVLRLRWSRGACVGRERM